MDDVLDNFLYTQGCCFLSLVVHGNVEFVVKSKNFQIRLQAERASYLDGISRTEQARSERKKELAHDQQVIRQNLWAKASAKDEKRKAYFFVLLHMRLSK